MKPKVFLHGPKSRLRLSGVFGEYENHSLSSEWFGLLTKSKSEVKTAGLAGGFAFDDEKP